MVSERRDVALAPPLLLRSERVSETESELEVRLFLGSALIGFVELVAGVVAGVSTAACGAGLLTATKPFAR